MSFQKEKLKKTLAVSLFIHILVGTFFLVSKHLNQSRSKNIEIISLKVKKKKEKRAHQKTTLTHQKKKAKKEEKIHVYSQGKLSTYSKVILSGKDGYEVQKEISIDTDSLIYPFLKKLHDKLSNSISYPENLVRKKEMGIITAQFDINSQGVMIGQPEFSYSESPKLKKHLTKALEKTLRKPLDPHSKLPLDKIRIVTRFDFKVVSHESIFPKDAPEVVKNVLHFYKYAARSHSLLRAGANGTTSGTIQLDPFQLLEAEQEQSRL